MTAIAVTMIAPPPMPCSARAATSIVIDPASPHSTEPDEEEQHRRPGTPALRPNRSPSFPTIGGDDGRGEQIARHHPGLVARTAEIGDHRRQGGGHDGLIERGQQHAEQHRDEDEVASPWS